jgi:hypothetical protein
MKEFYLIIKIKLMIIREEIIISNHYLILIIIVHHYLHVVKGRHQDKEHLFSIKHKILLI